MQGARGLEAVRVSGDAAHGVEGDRATNHLFVRVAAEVGPRLVQHDGRVKGGAGDFRGQCIDALRREAALLRHSFGGVSRVEIGLGHAGHDTDMGDACTAHMAIQVGQDTGRVKRHLFAAAPVDDDRFAIFVAEEQAVGLGFRVAVQKYRCIGEPREVFDVDASGLEQRMHKAEDKQTIRAGGDPDPIVRHRVVPGANGIHADDLCTAGLELTDADLDRVAVVVFGYAKQDKQLGVLPIRGAELPKRAAHGVDTARGHVDGTKPAVRGEIRRPELLCPPAGEALALIAARKEGELFRCRVAQGFEPRNGCFERFVPGNLFELARTAGANTLQRRAQAGGRGVLHDARRALCTQNAAIDRVVPVAFDVGDLFRTIGGLFHVHVDAAAAGAHVASGLADFVRDLRRRVDLRLSHESSRERRLLKGAM